MFKKGEASPPFPSLTKRGDKEVGCLVKNGTKRGVKIWTNFLLLAQKVLNYSKEFLGA